MNGSRTVSWTQALAELGVVLRLDAEEAEKLLDAACEGAPTRCRRCAGERLYELNGGRLRCAKCKYSFYKHTGRWLGRHRLPAKTWLAAIKAFELGLGHQALAQVCELSLPTAAELEKTIQMSIAVSDASWVGAVKACDSGVGIPRRFRAEASGASFRVEPVGEGADGPVVEMPEHEALRAFRMGVRRWAKLPADRFALKLKEWQVRSTHEGSLFELALDSLVRYMPAGINERKGGVTSVLHPGAKRPESPLGHHPKHHGKRGQALRQHSPSTFSREPVLVA
ncbi:MAG: transposase [Elusimicrobia bacterium]|nr:transposase [Elusimicrobiota bacterium]